MSGLETVGQIFAIARDVLLILVLIGVLFFGATTLAAISEAGKPNPASTCWSRLDGTGNCK